MNNEHAQIAADIFGMPGRLVGLSKSMYIGEYPDHEVVFNANICTDDAKIWYGDIDITLDEAKLKDLAESIGCKIYVLREMDGRFGLEDTPALDKAVWTS